MTYFGWIHNFNMCKWKVTRFSGSDFCALPLASDISSSYFYYITNLEKKNNLEFWFEVKLLPLVAMLQDHMHSELVS